jgi:hypothetical protein
MARSLIAAIGAAAIPTLLLLAAARIGLLSAGSGPIAYAVLVLAWLTGMAAISLAGWSRQITSGLMVIYSLIAIPALPFASLLAVCTTGDCI